MHAAAFKNLSSETSTQGPPHVPGFARWALLLLLFLTAAALVTGSFVGLRAARAAAIAVARATGLGIVREVRRELRRSRGEFQKALDEVFADLNKEGLGFVAIVDEDQQLLAAAGPGHKGAIAGLMADWSKNHRRHFSAGLSILPMHKLGDDGRYHVVVPLRPGPPGHMRHMRRMMHGMGSAQGLGNRPPLFLAFEFEPIEARGIMRRGMLTFSVSLVAALLLLAAGLVFWRMQGRSEQLRLQLAADAQLKSLGQMSAVLGHELRNPLTALKGHAQLLLELLGEGQPGHNSASQVVREAQRLEKLTTEVLDFARSGQVQREQVELQDFVHGCVARAQAGEVELQLQAGLGTWSLDAARIERVLGNLLRNARQSAGAQGRVQLRVATAHKALRMEVEDNGPGLPPGEDLSKLFEPFVTSKIHGTGLGLALARAIVQAHGGKITARPAPGGGAIFAFVLPLVDDVSI